jgi:hypothetical protein
MSSRSYRSLSPLPGGDFSPMSMWRDNSANALLETRYKHRVHLQQGLPCASKLWKAFAYVLQAYIITGLTHRSSREVYRTSSVVKQMGKKGATLSSVTLSLALAKEFLRDSLTIKQLRIEIWTPEGGWCRRTRMRCEPGLNGNTQEIQCQ